jgi:hypothetical protein
MAVLDDRLEDVQAIGRGHHLAEEVLRLAVVRTLAAVGLPTKAAVTSQPERRRTRSGRPRAPSGKPEEFAVRPGG